MTYTDVKWSYTKDLEKWSTVEDKKISEKTPEWWWHSNIDGIVFSSAIQKFLGILMDSSKFNYTELGNNILLYNLQSAFNKVHFTKCNLHSAISKT